MGLPRFHVQISCESELDRLEVETSERSEQRQRLVRVLHHGGDLRQGKMFLKHLAKSSMTFWIDLFDERWFLSMEH